MTQAQLNVELVQGAPKTSRTEENIQIVEKIILSQEDQPQTHKSLKRNRNGHLDSQVNGESNCEKRPPLKPVRLVKAAALTEDHKRRRIACCKRFSQRFTIRKLVKTIFTDEKMTVFMSLQIKQKKMLTMQEYANIRKSR